ncbi:Uncharacterized protein BM_BM8545 [Brugia malayi]|uniref:Uncharacterized protein n=1 Tax=Brugia malayi TaxID=6279 RepID=A0A4E9EQP8_BRUMA|nr:Uncharacterized protein BM_BM8545 [Brugia malayi]VIO86078.1 Uncharacterized protein BM_BM8545 [Brugia malayi]
MSAKQQTGNVAAPVDNGELVRIMDDDACSEPQHASNAMKKNRIHNNNSNNTDMPVHNPPPSTCWCNGISDDIRAIKETLNSVSNGIHLILQKVHMDQMNNAQMMSQILRTVEMVADTVNNMSFVQFQGYGEYYDGSGVGNPIGIPDGTAPPETCYEQTNEQNMPIEHIMNNSSRSYP